MAAPREAGQEPPKWLAREMNDPWVGDEARELWEGAQSAQREAAAYREVMGTPAEARAIKEIYPGGVAEARSAAERARELAEIDAAIFGAPGRGAEELRAGRAQLVERLYAQDPGAFQEMVEAGVRLLEKTAGGQRSAVSEERRDLNAETQKAQSLTERQVGSGKNGGSSGDRVDAAQPGMAVPQVATAYREFERATNAELERSVGGAIGRALEEALPNLKATGSARSSESAGQKGQAVPLQERLQVAVKEEVEAGLRSDTGLGEQVTRVLSGKRFDGKAREQVVRLIDARARQLVPGAVKKVVGSWTAATLGTKKPEVRAENQRTIAPARNTADAREPERDRERRDSGRSLPRGKVDYRKWSDEQILEM